MEHLCPVCGKNPLKGKQQACSSACRTAKHRAKLASETGHTATPRTLPKPRNMKQKRGPRPAIVERKSAVDIAPDQSVPSSVAERLLLAIAELRTAIGRASTEPRSDMRTQITSQAPAAALGYRLVIPHHEPGVPPSFSPRRRDGAPRAIYSLSPFQYPDDLRLCDGRWYRIVWIDSQGKQIRTPASCPIPGLRYVVGPADAVATATATMSAPPIETECAAATQTELTSVSKTAPVTAPEAALETSRDTPEQAPPIHVPDTFSATKATAVTEKPAEASLLSQKSASGTVTPAPREAPEPSAVARPAASVVPSATQALQMECASSRAQNLGNENRRTGELLTTLSAAELSSRTDGTAGQDGSPPVDQPVNTDRKSAQPTSASWSKPLDSFPPITRRDEVMTPLFCTKFWLLAQFKRELQREASAVQPGSSVPLRSYPIDAETWKMAQGQIREYPVSVDFAPRCLALLRYIREHGASALADFPCLDSPVLADRLKTVECALRNPIERTYMKYLSARFDALLDEKPEPEEPKVSLTHDEQRLLTVALSDIRTMMYFRQRMQSRPVKSDASA